MKKLAQESSRSIALASASVLGTGDLHRVRGGGGYPGTYAIRSPPLVEPPKAAEASTGWWF